MYECYKSRNVAHKAGVPHGLSTQRGSAGEREARGRNERLEGKGEREREVQSMCHRIPLCLCI